MKGPARFTAVALFAWAFSRCAVMLWWAYTPYGEAAAVDLNRYAYFATGSISTLGLNWFPWEYPALARVILGSSFGLDLVGYVSAYLLAMVALDLAFTIWLLRPRQLERSPAGVWLWITALPLLGAIPYSRYDMVVACSAALAIAWSGHRPRTAAVLLSLAIALKLWPLFLLPLLVWRVRPEQRRRVLFAAFAPWIAFEALGAFLWGTRSVMAPWLWQRERGLQIESIAAGPFRILSPGADPIEFRFNAWETTSPAWLMTLLALVGLVLVAWVLVTSGRQLKNLEVTDPRADTIVATAAVLVIGLLIVTGKVLSPQYLLWLIAPLAVACSLRRDRDRWLLALVVVVAALTTLVYPVMYGELVAGEVLAWVVLQLRNLLLLVVVAILAVAWRDAVTPQVQRASQHETDSGVTT